VTWLLRQDVAQSLGDSVGEGLVEGQLHRLLREQVRGPKAKCERQDECVTTLSCRMYVNRLGLFLNKPLPTAYVRQHRCDAARAIPSIQRPRRERLAQTGAEMTVDPTMRIIWYGGKPYGISSAPFGTSEPPTEWHILMPSGWLPLFPYRPTDEWPRIERQVLDWLNQGTASTE
jgi:hypothetical protein